MPSTPSSPLFPYTTLFRSLRRLLQAGCNQVCVGTGDERGVVRDSQGPAVRDRKSTRLNSSHLGISYAVYAELSTLSLHDALPISSATTSSRMQSSLRGNW